MTVLNRQALMVARHQDLGTFIVKVFQTLSPGVTYLHNWSIDAIVYQLMLVHQRYLKRLIINQPPRSLKSICTSVAYVAWCLGHDPTMRFACVSYSHELATAFARQFRQVVNSSWYRELFPNVRITKDTETDCETSRGGGRIAVSVGGTFTGRGAHVLILDDPMKADDAMSEVARRKLHEWYSRTLLSRMDDKARGAIILVAQRLHEDDLPGRLLRDGGWAHLNLPAIAQEDEEIAIGRNASNKRKKGEALHPEREPLEVLEDLAREMGRLSFSAQYLQRPVPAEGNLVRRKDIQWYDAAPEGGEVVQSWDLASTTGEHNDYSVCTTWLMVKRHYYLLDVWRGRLEFPKLRHKLIELAGTYRPDTLLIERAGPGLHMIQELRANPINSVPEPIGIQPEGEKIVRMEAQAARFEAGQVHLPNDAHWLDDFLHEILAFPSSRHDDQIDSVSQFLNWAQRRHGDGPDIICGPIIFPLE
ncbi:MAG: phage terminase large subunit [Rhizobiaceae bacterium]